MPPAHSNTRATVLRASAQNLLLISLVSFAGSVILTRLFLSLTGYPKIGSGELHIAHVLWGGLILFIAALLPLIFANQWILTLGALLSGIGVGLFIDEVGKFITLSNDYFYPPAAPIIYAVFLLTALVYLRVRRPPAWNARSEFYRVLEGFTEVLDGDLEPSEKAKLLQRLKPILEKTTEEDLRRMAQALVDVLEHDQLRVVPDRQSTLEKTRTAAQKFERRYFNRGRLRLTLILAMAVVGFLALFEALSGLFSGGSLNLTAILSANIRLGEVRSQTGALWFFVHLALQSIVGVLALLSSSLILIRAEKRGIEIGTACLVLSLTLVNLLAFFVDQFSAASTALVQLVVLLGFLYYQRRYMRASVTD